MYFGVLLHFLLINIYRCYCRLLFWISSGLMFWVPFQWTTCDDGMIFLALPVKKNILQFAAALDSVQSYLNIAQFLLTGKVVVGSVIILFWWTQP